MSRNNKYPKNNNSKTIDKRIKDIVSESWIASFYFSIAINELKQKIDAMSDDQLNAYLQNLIAPEAARSHIDYIYSTLNNL